MKTKIAFVGGGNMTQSIVRGLLNRDFDARDISVADPSDEQRKVLSELSAELRVTNDNHRACAGADLVILAVKPQIMADVCRALDPAVASETVVFVSVAAGIRCDDIRGWLGGDPDVARAMPNQPALLGAGATGLFFAGDPEKKPLIQALMDAVGTTAWVQSEAILDAVTAVSGSGPAYFYRLMELMIEAGAELGLDETTARKLVVATAAGAAEVALTELDSIAQLRRRVTSPGGTTEAALAVFDNQALPDTVAQALNAAYQRAGELADTAAGS